MQEKETQIIEEDQVNALLKDKSIHSGEQATQLAMSNATKAVSELVRTTLGPSGRDKMLITSEGSVVITNDGATILDERWIDIEHPVAKMVVEVAKAQKTEIGDGTTTATIFAAQLLQEAVDLEKEGTHPTTIVNGYLEALEIAQSVISDQCLNTKLGEEEIRSVAITSITRKTDIDISSLIDPLIKAIVDVEREDLARECIQVYSCSGSSVTKTKAINGYVLEAEPVSDQSKKIYNDATIAVFDSSIGVVDSELKTEYRFNGARELKKATDSKENRIRSVVEELKNYEVDVVFAMDAIADQIGSALAKEGILAIERLKTGVNTEDLQFVSNVTNGSRLSSIDELSPNELGTAKQIRVEESNEGDFIVIESDENSRQKTILIRGSTDHVASEYKRCVNDAIDSVLAAIKLGGVVPGAGHIEMAISERVRAEANDFDGREQLAMKSYADAIEYIPQVLAQNSGIDPINSLVEMKSRIADGHCSGIVVDKETNYIGDPVVHDILDPIAVKQEVIRTATEMAAIMIRIDDIIMTEVTGSMHAPHRESRARKLR